MNTLIMARQSEAATLRWLHRFGYLTAAQLGRLLWPQSSNEASRLRMAQRVIARLDADGRVIVRKGMPGEPSHIGLSLKGVYQLHTAHGIEGAVSAKDLLRTISSHRDASNEAAIGLMLDGWHEVWTEREIVTGKAPFREVGKKVPDCAAADEEGLVTWVEIENCRRGGRDMTRLASWLRHTAFPVTDRMMPLDALERYWLARVRFVLAAKEAATFPDRLRRAIEKYGGEQMLRNQVEFQDAASGGLLPW
ncbi:MAG: hypothetical protein RBS35_06310 [Azonexus sp.]|jgi:hypothetical protein|nr:hypothetical protein [Azonexus sp.]